MSNLIYFPVGRTRKPKQAGEYRDDLTALLKQAVKLAEAPIGEEVNGIFLMNADLKKTFQRKISGFLLDHQLCDSSSLFKCSLYVSDLISENLVHRIRSYCAADFMKEGVDSNNPWVFKEGADLCFLLCSFFDGRGNWRMMRPEDYYRMGASFYAMFYYGTRMEIACHMSRRYAEMVKITKHCINTL